MTPDSKSAGRGETAGTCRTMLSQVRSTGQNRRYPKGTDVQDDFFHGQLRVLEAVARGRGNPEQGCRHRDRLPQADGPRRNGGRRREVGRPWPGRAADRRRIGPPTRDDRQHDNALVSSSGNGRRRSSRPDRNGDDGATPLARITGVGVGLLGSGAIRPWATTVRVRLRQVIQRLHGSF